MASAEMQIRCDKKVSNRVTNL